MTIYGADTFTRTATGWGDADTGGAWTGGTSTTGSKGLLSVSSGSGPGVSLRHVTVQDCDVQVDFSANKVTNSGTFTVNLGARATGYGANGVQMNVGLPSSGVATIQIQKTISNTSSTNTRTSVYFTPAADVVYRMKLRVTGSTTTTIHGKVWIVGDTEPDWQSSWTATDSALNAAGYMSTGAYLSGSASNGPITLSYDGVLLGDPYDAPTVKVGQFFPFFSGALAGSDTGGGGEPENLYRPLAITNPLSLPHAPADANYVTWSSGTGTVQSAVAGLGANDILVLPERVDGGGAPIPYVIDSSGGFPRNGAMCTPICRGIVGLGPNAVITTSASSYTAGQQSSDYVTSVIRNDKDNAYFANFTMQGQGFGGIAYNGLRVEGNNVVVERIFFDAAHRGFANGPPGETGGLDHYKGHNLQVFNCEVECRDSTGTRVAPSPMMFNGQGTDPNCDVHLTDCYMHHSNAGMPTFYKIGGTSTTLRCRSEYNGGGTGGLGGSAWNHEMCYGTINHTDITLICDRNGATGNSGLHFSCGSNNGNSVTFNVTVLAWDNTGPISGKLAILYLTPYYTPFTENTWNITNSVGGAATPYQIYR